MNKFEVALLIAAAGTMFLTRSLPRAWLWIFVGFLSFLVSAVWWRLGLPHHPAATLVCDAAVCLSIYSLAKEEYEIWLYDIFRLSVLISLLKLFGIIHENLVYAAALECVNFAALLLLGGTGILAGTANDENGYFGSWSGNFHRLRVSLRSSRRTPPWFTV